MGSRGPSGHLCQDSVTGAYIFIAGPLVADVTCSSCVVCHVCVVHLQHGGTLPSLASFGGPYPSKLDPTNDAHRSGTSYTLTVKYPAPVPSPKGRLDKVPAPKVQPHCGISTQCWQTQPAPRKCSWSLFFFCGAQNGPESINIDKVLIFFF